MLRLVACFGEGYSLINQVEYHGGPFGRARVRERDSHTEGGSEREIERAKNRMVFRLLIVLSCFGWPICLILILFAAWKAGTFRLALLGFL